MYHKHIFLVGPMGAGKSTIGKALAQQLQLSFIDVDKFIEQEAQCSIPQIFEQHGEAYFRELEHNCLIKILKNNLKDEDTTIRKSRNKSEDKNDPKSSCKGGSNNNSNIKVIAGGGGIAMRQDNRDLIKEHALCVYLHASVDIQYARVKDDTNRPMILVDNIKDRLNTLFQMREPQFRSIADLVVEASQDVPNIMQQCIDFLNQKTTQE